MHDASHCTEHSLGQSWTATGHFLMSSEVTPHSTLQPRFNNSILENLEAKTPPLRKQQGIFISHSHKTKRPSSRNTRPLPLQLLPAPCFHALASDRGLEKGVGACREETRWAAVIGFHNYKGQRQNETLQAANGGGRSLEKNRSRLSFHSGFICFTVLRDCLAPAR